MQDQYHGIMLVMRLFPSVILIRSDKTRRRQSFSLQYLDQLMKLMICHYYTQYIHNWISGFYLRCEAPVALYTQKGTTRLRQQSDIEEQIVQTERLFVNLSSELRRWPRRLASPELEALTSVSTLLFVYFVKLSIFQLWLQGLKGEHTHETLRGVLRLPSKDADFVHNGRSPQPEGRARGATLQAKTSTLYLYNLPFLSQC